MKLIIGLGNPGDKYKKTRHNAGFMAADHLAGVFGFDSFKKVDKFKAELAEGEIEGEKALLVKPVTYMNLSGQAVSALIQFYKVPVKDVVVIYDEAELPLGSLRLRPKGSSGGHNGIKSLISDLGTDTFLRIRLGIKPTTPFPGALEDYVLGQFKEEENKEVEEIIHKIPGLLSLLFKEGIESAMKQYN